MILVAKVSPRTSDERESLPGNSLAKKPGRATDRAQERGLTGQCARTTDPQYRWNFCDYTVGFETVLLRCCGQWHVGTVHEIGEGFNVTWPSSTP